MPIAVSHWIEIQEDPDVMNLTAKNIVVVGLAHSGLATARFLCRKGAKVTITDRASLEQLRDSANEAEGLGARLELGGHRQETFDSADLIVVSPGVPHTIPPLKQARAKGIDIIGEIELAGRFITAPIIAITGTNGKTTTTELLGHIMACADRPTFVGGNIGTPLITYADNPNADASVLVVELSSFQLDTIQTFRPDVAVLLNISSDHVDRYGDMNAYVFSKGRIFENQTEEDVAVCNSDDPRIMALIPAIKSRKIFFGHLADARSEDDEERKALIDHRRILVRGKDRPTKHFDLTGSSLLGAHNMENAAAAILAAQAVGIDDHSIQKALDTFIMQPHRLERIATINGVTYINDSKATNVDAVARALACFDAPIVLIMGGRNKDNDFGPLRKLVHRHVATLITYGEAGDDIQKALKGACNGRSFTRKNFEDAVLLAHDMAETGQTVLLSPACASFDQFSGYSQRGDKFRSIVEGYR